MALPVKTLAVIAWLPLASPWAGPVARAEQAARPFAAAAPSGFIPLAPPAPATALSVLSCLAALLSCGFSFTLWRRVDSGQEAAKASMYAAGKLFDSAARRFARSQDEAGSAVEAATGAAGQAGQAASRLAAAVRETEARLSACVGEGEARLHAASGLVSRYESAIGGVPALLNEALDRLGASALPAIEEAAAGLRQSGAAAADRLRAELQALPDLVAAAMEAAEVRSGGALQQAVQALQSRAESIASAAQALPAAGAMLGEAADSLAAAQARHALLIERVEALAGVLPSIATSLASTAAGQRQLLAQGRAGVESGLQEMRHAASTLSSSVDEAAVLLRRTQMAGMPHPLPSAAPPPMHPALRPRDLSQVMRHPGEDAVQPG